MSCPSENIRELEEAISSFAIDFELVFDNDWNMTKDRITNAQYYIEDDGTFLQPNVINEDSNWFNRGNLLTAYRHLVEVLKKNNIPYSICSEDESTS